MTLTTLLVLADVVLAAAVFLGVSTVRFESDPRAVWSVGVDAGTSAVIFAGTWTGVCWLLGLYRLQARWSFVADARDVARAGVTVAAVSLSLLFLFHQDNVSRLFLALLLVIQPLAATALRALLRRRFEVLHRSGKDPTFMLIAGTGRLAEQFANQIERHPALGIRVVGHLEVPLTEQSVGSADLMPPGLQSSVSRPILGSIDQMHDVFRSRVVDEVGVCLPLASSEYLEPIAAVAADEGKTVRIPREMEDGVLRHAITEHFEDYVLYSVVPDGQRELERAAKRVLDIAGAIIGLVLLSPLIIGTAICIQLRDGGPVLFRQVRVGRHGRPFTILKFRTMSIDAEDRYSDVAGLSDTRGAAFKMARDPRVTRLGRILRKWALDELPQLFNVLTGDMSLVGPRPAPPREVDQYDIWHRRRLSVRPGMTGLWQVHDRFDDHFDDRAQLDLRYIDEWSLWMDLGILARTIPALLAARGR